MTCKLYNMTKNSWLLLIAVIIVSCQTQTENANPAVEEKPVSALVGTWQLLTGTIIKNADTTVTDYTKGKKFLKIITDTHFSFVGHDTNGGKDSTNALFSAGSGTYTLADSTYTEHLEFCNAREWENHDFTFNVTIKNDTLVQQGIEKVGDINQYNIEKYVRVKK